MSAQIAPDVPPPNKQARRAAPVLREAPLDICDFINNIPRVFIRAQLAHRV